MINAQTTDIKLDTANILAKIDQIQARLPELAAQEKDDYLLQRYLEEMTTYTEGMLSSVEPSDGYALEAADSEMAALERFLNESEESSEVDTQLTPPASTSATVERIQVQQSPVESRQKAEGKYPLFSGPLIIDIPLPQQTLWKFPHAQAPNRDEFTHVRYTAVTCDPKIFKEKGYSLRAGLFTKPRATTLLLSIFLNPEHRTSLFDILSKIWDAFDRFNQLPSLGQLALKDVRWKYVALHLHFATVPEAESQSCLQEICARPVAYDDPGPGGKLSSSFNETAYFNGERVLWQMYEVWYHL
jgi:hypothetical protein